MITIFIVALLIFIGAYRAIDDMHTPMSKCWGMYMMYLGTAIAVIVFVMRKLGYPIY